MSGNGQRIFHFTVTVDEIIPGEETTRVIEIVEIKIIVTKDDYNFKIDNFTEIAKKELKEVLKK